MLEIILLFIICFFVVTPTFTIIWFLILLHFTIPKAKNRYNKMTKDDKDKVKLEKSIDVFKAFYFKHSLINYLINIYIEKERTLLKD